MMAAPRSVDDAQQIAKQFLSTSTNGLRLAATPAQLKLAHTFLQADQQPAFYVFNQGDDNGFVLVSADDNARQILGYSQTGSFNEADMPCHAQSSRSARSAIPHSILCFRCP